MALTPPQYKQMKQFLESDQRNKKFSLLQDDLEPGPLKDELLKDFDPSQETYEEYLRRKNLERPFNMADGGMLVKPGFGGVRQGYREEARFKQEGLETRVSNKIRDLIKKKQPINPKTGKVYTMKEYASLTRGQKDKLSSRLRDKFKSKVRSPRLGYYPEKDANKLINFLKIAADKQEKNNVPLRQRTFINVFDKGKFVGVRDVKANTLYTHIDYKGKIKGTSIALHPSQDEVLSFLKEAKKFKFEKPDRLLGSYFSKFERVPTYSEIYNFFNRDRNAPIKSFKQNALEIHHRNLIEKMPDKKFQLVTMRKNTEANRILNALNNKQITKKEADAALKKLGVNLQGMGKKDITTGKSIASAKRETVKLFKDALKENQNIADDIAKKLEIKKLVGTLSKDPRCRLNRFKGGRVGLQDGSASLDICFRQGVDNINRGLPNPTAAQARNFGRVAALGRNVVKFGVLPEALFVAGESVIRAGMGDTLPEAILRASEYLLPGNQTKIADRMMLARTVGPKTAELILKANELRGFENQIENLENEKQFTGILTDDGFDDNFFGQTKVEEENAIQNRINALQNQKKSYKALTEAQYNFADRKAQEAEDIRKSKALFPKLFAKARSIQPDFDDPLREGVQQTLDLNLEMPNRFQREIDLFYRSPDVQALVNTPDQQLSNLFKGQDLENIKQLKIDTKNQLAETVSEAAAINPEGMFGAQGVFATPLDLGVSYTPPPIDSIDEMEKEIIGQTNVANPFDLDTSSVATGLRGFSAAGGGIAKLAGVPSGPPPSSGPNSQGLQGLLKRVRNR